MQGPFGASAERHAVGLWISAIDGSRARGARQPQVASSPGGCRSICVWWSAAIGRPSWLAEEEIGPELALIEDPRDRVEALLDTSASCGLLILGGRHLRGVPALGSVSERVAHRAVCPVLVVR
jgi:hypothetical protein